MKPVTRITCCLLYLLFFLLSASPLFAQFRQLYTDTEPDNEIYKTSFYSASQGFVGFRDWIGFTSDSGHTFTKKYITIGNVDYNGYGVNLTFGFGINGVKAFSQDTVIAYGDYGLVPAILYSTNGGNTFKLVYHSQFNNLQLRTGIMDMIFPQNNNTGYAVDADRILKTTDKGLTWVTVLTDPGRYYDYLEAVDNNYVFAFSVGYSTSRLVKTSNAGGSWQTVTLPAGQRMNYAHFISSGKGWLASYDDNYDGNIFYTSNGGSTWTQKNNSLISPFSPGRMRFINDSTGYALAGLFELYKTSDSGRIWDRIPRDNAFTYLGYSLNDLQIWNSNQIWAGGGHGYLELTTNGGGQLIPTPLFQTDTTNLYLTNTVKLINYSKQGYQYAWFVNNQPAGTSYHSSYTHDPFSLEDSVMLVVSNGPYSDTAIKHLYFFPPVVVTSFTPVMGPTGTVVTITGLNFTGATNVLFGGTNASFTVLSSTSIRATVGSGSSGAVTVITPTGFGSLPGFTYIPPPTVSSFTPTTAATGTTVTITGNNFYNVTNVSFGGVPAASFNTVSSTTITAVVPAGASGNIVVTAAAGSGSLPGFVIIPVLASFTPTSGTFGTYMTLTGTGLGGVTAITVGGIPVRSFIINSHTSITAVVAAGGSGVVSVTAPGGTSTQPGFSYFEPPVISSFSPASGPVGTPVTITGVNFDGNTSANTVYFGAVKATITGGTANTLQVIVPTGATFRQISVTSHNLTAISGQPFLVTFANGGSITQNSFATRTDWTTGTDYTPVHTQVGDIDGDGLADLVVNNRGYYVINTAISILRNTSTSTTVSFAPRIDYNVPDPSGLTLSDIDGDGKLDFAVSDGDNSRIILYRNTSSPGAVSFAGPLIIGSPRFGGGLSVEDFDGDGKPDMLISSGWDNTTSIYRNISNPGAMAFSPRVNLNYTVGSNATSCDLDQDGKTDLAFSSGIILKNTSVRGTVSFAAPQGVPSYTHTSISSGDIDGDGKTDLVFTDNDGSRMGVLRNTSSGGSIAFAPMEEFSAVSSPTSCAVSDLDGDGRLDVAVTLIDKSMGVFKNTSTPGNISFGTRVDFSPAYLNGSNSITIGDLNGDGKPDPIICSEMRRNISIFLNDVKPEPFIQSFSPTIGESGTAVTITGVNFTGTTSVSFGGVPASSFTVVSPTSIQAVVGSGTSGDVSVTNAAGTGIRPGFIYGLPPVITSFSPQTGVTGSSVVISGNHFSPVTLDNIVYFGGVRAAVTSASATAITVIVPAGNMYRPVSVTTGGRTAFSGYPFITQFPAAGNSITTSSFGARQDFTSRGGGGGNLADLDGDGKLDLIDMYGGSGIGVSRNTSTGTSFSFAPVQGFPVGAGPTAIATGDLDGDGKTDLVASNYDGQSISILKNTSTVGTISFLTKIDILTGPSTTRPTGVVIMDFDGDGLPDIAVANYYSGTLCIFKNQTVNGNLSFANRIDYYTNGYPTGIAANDIDGDGRVDLLASINGPNVVGVFRNTSVAGTLLFESRKDFAVGSWPTSLTVGDLDGNGKPDIAVPNVNGAGFSLLQNTSTPGLVNFAARQDYPVSYRPNHLSFADVDGDGMADMALIKESSDFIYSNAMSMTIYKNTSTPGSFSFGLPVDFATGDYTNNSIAGDLDNDGKPDMVVMRSGGSFGIFRNQAGEAVGQSICAGTNTNMTSNVTGTTYQWQQNTGSGFTDLANNANVSGVTSATLSLVNVPASWNNYQFRCQVNGGALTSALFVLTVNAVPTANAGPNAAICSGSAGITIGTAGVAGLSYAWSPAAGLNAVSYAQPIASPTVTTSYTVTVTSQQGCSATSTMQLTVNPTPATPSVTPAGTSSVCSGGSALFTSSNATGNQWYLNNTAISGASSVTYQATQTGSYTVRSTVNGCASGFSVPVILSVNSVPSQPVISQTGNSLSSNYASGNQWYLNGNPITGATAANYTPAQAGQYYVRVTANGCTSLPSNTINFVLTAISSPVLDRSTFIGPNPVTGTLFIRNNVSTAIFELIIEDISGKRIIPARSFTGSCNLNLQHLSSGLYVVHVRNKRTGEHLQRLIVKI